MQISEVDRIEMLNWINENLHLCKEYITGGALHYEEHTYPEVFDNIKNQIITHYDITDVRETVLVPYRGEKTTAQKHYENYIFITDKNVPKFVHVDLLVSNDLLVPKDTVELIKYILILSAPNEGGVLVGNMETKQKLGREVAFGGIETIPKEGEITFHRCKYLHKTTPVIGDKPRIGISYSFIVQTDAGE